MAASRYLEEFTPGQHIVSDEFEFTDGDLHAFGVVSRDQHPIHTRSAVPDDELMAQGPYGIARYFGTVYESGVVTESIIGALDAHWHFRHPIRLGARLRYETTITGWRRSSSEPNRGVLHRYVRLLDSSDTIVQEGSTAALVHTLRDNPADDPAGALPLSLNWARAVVEILEEDTAFHDATQLYDGTIGLASDLSEVQFRIYRGQISEVSTRTPRGPEFTLRGDAVHWVELICAPRNELVVRANRGEFSVAGDAYRYLQLTEALQLLVDAARRLALEENAR